MTTAQNHTHYYPRATYMHALTLATEAYISKFSKKEVQASAVQIIMQLNQAMVIAIENAGLAEAMLEKAVEQAEQLSDRGYGGYAQAIGYAIHSNYFIPAGVAEAIVLPEILKSYGAKVEQKIASLARQTGIVSIDLPDERTARLFISWIDQQRVLFELPDHIEQMRPQDIPDIIDDTLDAALHFYPTPVFYDAIDLEQFLAPLLASDKSKIE
ncbi:MAG: iron-containing alcohol dehydrogenase [Paludibacteraceae bacterium]|nr:iron-containing alcohol dehydrogenase [Paludibacteraceae bacterium]